MKKAGLSSAATSEPEKPAEAPADQKRESGWMSAAPAAKPASNPASMAPEVVEERPCTKCGTVFLPKLAKHRLCPKCAEEHFTAAKAEKPAGAARPEGEKPARAAGEKPAGPRPERRERTPRQPQRGPQAARPAQEGQHHEAHREPVQREPQREAPQGFPRDYLASGYFAGNVMRDELFDTWARHVAGLLVTRGLSAKELRAFYGHVRRAEESAKAGRDFGEVREEILKMRPVAAARLGRKQIPSEFADFLERNIDQVKDTRTLGAFVEHFQGVVGYTAGKLRK
jgi:CRISPR type III-A-associated protein Csm2